MATKIGSGGNNTVNGTKFSDMLFGMGGRDRIDGGKGKDWINGGTGNDTLTGGKGADTFVFDGAKSGKDQINDFSVTQDILAIAKGLNGIETAADVLDHAVEKNGNVVINLGGGNKITLKNVSLDDLKDDPGAHFAII